MNIHDLVVRFSDSEFIKKIISDANLKEKINLNLSQTSFNSILIYNLFKNLSRPIILLTSNSDQSEKYFNDFLCIFDSDNFVKIFHKFSSNDLISKDIGNIDSFDNLRRDKKKIFIFDPESITDSFSVRDDLLNERIEFRIGKDYKFSKISEILNKFLYEKKDFVYEPGDYAIRGGIVDVFPYIGKYPFRIEFLADSVESIREIDESTQRSKNNLEVVNITPNFIENDGQDLKQSIISFFDPDSIIFIDGIELLDNYFHDPSRETKIDIDDFWTKINSFQTIKNYIFGKSEGIVDYHISQHPNYNSSIKICYHDILKMYNDGYEINLLCEGEKKSEVLKSLLSDYEKQDNLEKLEIRYIGESLQNGFISHQQKIVVLTEHEIFNRFQKRTYSKRKKIKGFTSKDLDSIRRGEYVVHIDYGVGIFEKLQRIRVGDSEQECVKLRYQDGDSLFVNLNYISRIRRYNASEGVIPKINKLGSGEWDRLKSKTKKKIKDIARDLITLYAKRKSNDGFSFNSDTIWQKELEISFMYEDTPDQISSVEAVKKDMESPSPMDRLICGDVGYGKTEVAIRAAFKCVMDGKQVAVLVPTTILAEQHYKTFTERLKNYPVSIASLSRFRTLKEQKQIVEKLKEKKIDIIIGTHRILSKDIEFTDLGLLIIDEEHRFGVTAKEKLRQIKVNVDTLTLTATPIPRTLNFSLMGSRDLSIIETPPKNRLPIETEIIKSDDNLIRNGILREIHRGGQVYFVNDKVNNLDKIQTYLLKLLPELRIGVAHGQMKSSQLEKVMIDFLEKKYDMLITTKIIESGLDITNVNTIIVNRADRFGLAELYQLRGRVGRSNVQAYSYFIVPGFEMLSTKALQRLQALEEFSELSSGFKLALRDMEIRGVGNFLGAEQSGFVESMGFELYCKILDETIVELKEEEFKEFFEKSNLIVQKKIDVNIEVDVDAFLPETFIPDDSERFSYYQKLYESTSFEGIDDLKIEIIDKYGKLSLESENLIKIVLSRIYLSKLNASKMTLKKNRCILFFINENFKNDKSFDIFNKFIEFLQIYPSSSYYLREIKDDLTLNIVIELGSISYLDWILDVLKRFDYESSSLIQSNK